MVAKSVNNVQKGGGKRVFKNSLHEKLLAWKNGTDMSAVDEVAGIPETAWCGGGDIISFPSSLSPAERRIAHQLCLRLDLFHASSGEGENRFVTVSKSGDFESIQQSTSMDEVTSNYCIWYDERSVKPLVKSKYFCLTDTEIHELQKCLVTAPGTVNEKVTVSLCADFLLDFELRNLSNMSHLNAKFPEGGKNRSDVECEQDMDKHHMLVDTVEGLHQAAAALSACFEVAFDLEMHSYRTYHGLTCLIQLSGGGYNYIVDPLAPLLWDLIGPLLGPIFANPNIVMIGHGIMGGDIPALYRDFGIIVVNAFDTQEASGFLGRTGVGLAALLDLWGCPLKREIATLKDRMKHADWRLRPLTDVMLRYATLDVHYLVSLYKLQVRELLLSSVACMGRGDKTGYQGQDGIPFIKNPKKSLPPKGKGNVLSVPKECSLTKTSQEKHDISVKKKEIVVSSGVNDFQELDDDDENNERLEVNDDSLAVHMLLDIKNREALLTQDSVNNNNDNDIYDDDEDEEGAEVWGLDPAVEVEVGLEVGMEGNTNNKNDFKSKLNYTNDRFHNEAGGEDDDDDIGEPEDDENCGILASQCIEMDDVEGDDDDDDLWDGWGEEVTAQDTTQNQIQNVSLGDANSTDLSISNMADDKKKGGGGGTDYKSDIKYDKNNTNNTTNTTTNKKNSKNHKNDKDGDGIKGPGSACKPVSSRAQQQQKRKEIKALKFDREKAKRLETIMIKAQKLQLYEEEKKFRNQNEQGKKENEEKSTEKTEIERSVIENENKIINENDNRKEEKIIENESLNSDSKEMKVIPLSVTPSPEIKKTVEKSNTENRGEKKEEKEEMGEEKKEDILSIAGRVQETIEVDATVEKKIVQKVVKKVVKEVEVCDGDTNHEYGDSDSVEEDDDDDDVDHEVEVEVGAKNILTPSNQEDDDDALLKRRSLGRGFLRDIMAEYDNNNSNSNSNLNVLKETKEFSSLTSKTEQLPLPLSSSIIATIGASNLGSDPRLSELLGTLAASQQSCLKLWSPKKVSENAYTKVSGFSQRKKTRVGGGQWEVKNVFVFRILFSWREKEAERRDESPSYICRGSLLLDAAEFLPVTLSALMKLQSPLPASMRSSNTSTATSTATASGSNEITQRAGKVLGTETVTETETLSGTRGGAGESIRVGVGAGRVGVAVATATEENTETVDVIGVKEAIKECNINNHLKTSDDGNEAIIEGRGEGGGVDDVVDLVAAVKAALLSWESVMRKQNNSPSTDRPDDSSPELYREKHNKRSTYHNKNSPILDGKSNNLADVTITEASVPGAVGVILNDTDIITENPIKNNEVASNKDENLKIVNRNDKKSNSTVASISLLCAATILSVGAFVFLRRKG